MIWSLVLENSYNQVDCHFDVQTRVGFPPEPIEVNWRSEFYRRRQQDICDQVSGRIGHVACRYLYYSDPYPCIKMGWIFSRLTEECFKIFASVWSLFHKAVLMIHSGYRIKFCNTSEAVGNHVWNLLLVPQSPMFLPVDFCSIFNYFVFVIFWNAFHSFEMILLCAQFYDSFAPTGLTEQRNISVLYQKTKSKVIIFTNFDLIYPLFIIKKQYSFVVLVSVLKEFVISLNWVFEKSFWFFSFTPLQM